MNYCSELHLDLNKCFSDGDGDGDNNIDGSISDTRQIAP